MKHRPLVPYVLTLGVFATLAGHGRTAFAQTAVALDGADDYVSLPSGTIPVSNLTIAVWVNAASHPALPSGVTLAAWGPKSGCFPSTQYLQLFSDHLEMFTGCGEAFRLDGGIALTIGAWHHVALTIDPVGNDVLYFNGVQVAAGNSRDGIPVVGGNDVIGAAWLGDFMPPELHFHGAIDELQIYNRLLSASEVSELFDAGKGRFGAVEGGGLLTGYHFD
jgi:arabinan endo-1,5-alpha-L-arabinosidase